MFQPHRKRRQAAGFTPVAHHSPAADAVESRSMMLAGMTLIAAIAVQFAIFATVLLGGRDALVAIGAALSWMSMALWRLGGDVAVACAGMLILAATGASLLALERKGWIQLSRSVRSWTRRLMQWSVAAVLLLVLMYAMPF